jgi:hypothetical protein
MGKGKSTEVRGARTCVFVLGMHRSGTSALAGLLTRLGCKAPVHQMAASRANPKGFFESTDIRDFNDELLESAGSCWDDFSHFPEAWLESPSADEFVNRAVALVRREFGDARLFVLKDPRICRLVPFWTRALEAAGSAVKPILTVRNPLEVGRSLDSKKGFSEPLSQLIWLRYNLDAEAASRGMPRFVTSFEELLNSWEAVAASAQDRLQLVWPKPIANVEIDVEKFLADDLRHHDESVSRALTSPLLPGWLRETYKILKQWAETGENAGHYPQLDRIRSEFDVASAAFARAVRGEREKAADAKEKVHQLKAECERLNAELKEKAAAEGERDELQARVAALTGEAEQQRAEVEKSFGKERAALQSERDALDQRLAALAAELEQQRQELDRALEEQRAAALVDLNAIATERDAVAAERKAALAARDAAMADADSAAADAAAQIGELKQTLQLQRRRTTLLEAELQRAHEGVESVRSDLARVQAESAESRSRRKEMARVITNREAKIAALSDDLRARYEELAVLERRILHSSPSWMLKTAFRRIRRIFTRPSTVETAAPR